MFSYAEKVPSYCFSYYTVFSVSFVIKAPRSQATKVIHIKKSSWTIKIRFSVATLFVRQGVLQQWHKKMLWALRSSEEHEKLLGFSPLAVLFTYHGNIHLLWKRWKREKHAKPHRAVKTLLLDFSSPDTTRQMKKWVSQYLTVWFMLCSKFKLTLAKMARWESKSNPDMRLMLYISSINAQKYYVQERYMKAVS